MSDDPPFTVQHVLDAGLRDDGVVTLEPLVLVLADEAGVVTTLQGALVVHHRKQRIPAPPQHTVKQRIHAPPQHTDS